MAPRPTPEPEQTSWKVLAFSGVASVLLVVGSLLLLSMSSDSDNSVEIVSPPVADEAVEPGAGSNLDENSSSASDSSEEAAFGPSNSADQVDPAPEPTSTPRPEPTSTPRPEPEPSPTARPTATAEPTSEPDNGATSLAELAAALLGDDEEPTPEPKPTARPTEIPALPRVIPSGQDQTPIATPIPRRPTAVPTAAGRAQQPAQPAPQAAQPAPQPAQPAPQPAAAAPVSQPAPAQQHEFEYIYTNQSNGRGGRQVIACNVGAVYVDVNGDGRADGYLNSPCDPCPSGSLPSDYNGDGLLDC